ncbi:hypothetical protein REPUB_Repub06bG0022900 [Reevesia pubescens]
MNSKINQLALRSLSSLVRVFSCFDTSFGLPCFEGFPLFLHQKQKEVIVDQEWIDDTLEAGKNCLIEKIMSRKSTNVEAMCNVLGNIWKVTKGLSVRDVGDNMYLFQFNDELEKDRTLVMQPWSFNKTLIILKEFNEMNKPKEYNMNWCHFWVQIHGLPLGMMNVRVGSTL